MILSTQVALAYALSLAALPAQAYKIPANLQAFYDKHKYCGDAPNIIYLKGPNNQYADMDTDCDGLHSSSGPCSNDPTGQAVTAFDDILQDYDVGLQHLDAHIHPYVVFGNEDTSPSFDPREQGVRPLSLMAVVCNGKLQYGIWGDTNGGQDTGEAAISLGQLCFGEDAADGNTGYTKHDVLYIAFEYAKAVPGAKGANWRAKTKEEFQQSIKALGDRLVAGL